MDFAEDKIRVNGISPGHVMVANLREFYEKNMDYVKAKTPIGRIGKPEDIAYLCVYLLSSTSSWMTGSCIDITGGANEL